MKARHLVTIAAAVIAVAAILLHGCMPPRDAEGVARTTRWLAENRPEPGGDIEERINDFFDYAVEDKLIERYQAMMSELSDLARRREMEHHHPYPHPNEPGLKRDHRNR